MQKILVLEASSVGQKSYALPFTTDAEVVAAWDFILANRYLSDISYRPQSEGADLGRAFLANYLETHREKHQDSPITNAHLIRLILDSLYQADMQHSHVELVEYEPQPHLNGRDVPACNLDF